LFFRCRVGVVPEDAVPALAQVGQEVEAEFLVGQRVVAAVAAGDDNPAPFGVNLLDHIWSLLLSSDFQ
jgi:hypothetical protein